MIPEPGTDIERLGRYAALDHENWMVGELTRRFVDHAGGNRAFVSAYLARWHEMRNEVGLAEMANEYAFDGPDDPGLAEFDSKMASYGWDYMTTGVRRIYQDTTLTEVMKVAIDGDGLRQNWAERALWHSHGKQDNWPIILPQLYSSSVNHLWLRQRRVGGPHPERIPPDLVRWAAKRGLADLRPDNLVVCGYAYYLVDGGVYDPPKERRTRP